MDCRGSWYCDYCQVITIWLLLPSERTAHNQGYSWRYWGEILLRPDYSISPSHEYVESPHVTGTYVESEEAPEQNGYYLDYEYGYKTKMDPEMMEEDITSFLRIVDDTDGNKTIFQVI